MSLQFNATTDYAYRDSNVAASGDAWTLMLDVMPESSPTGHIAMIYEADTVTNLIGFATWYTSGAIRLYIYYGAAEARSAGPYDLSNGAWYTLAICQNATGIMGYIYSNGGSRTLIFDGIGDARGKQTLTASDVRLVLGTTTSIHGNAASFKGCYRNVKWWPGTTLSTSDMDAEVTSGTPVTPDCSIHYPATETDFSGNVLTDSINAYNATINSGAYSASEPSYISAGASVAPKAASYFAMMRQT